MTTRDKTKRIYAGGVAIGGGAPVSVQSMCCTKTQDVDATLRQISALAAAGCDIVRLAVPDMDAARALRGQVFYFDRSDATLPEGRWYVADLIGCEVRDADTGKVYGVVTSVDHPGAQDIYTVKAPSGKEYMFPGVDAFLKERNPPEGYLLVTPIPGLLDDDFDSEREEE